MTSATENSGSGPPDDEQYYRLVPLSASDASEQERLNFRELLRYYYRKRAIIYWCLGAFLAIGLFFAAFSPTVYSSRATIIPEYELQDRVNEIIESYGLLFGLSGSIRENRTPSYLLKLYPHMINSVSFKQELMHKPLPLGSADSSITLYQYFTEIHQPSMLHTIYRYTLGLPGTIVNAMRSKPAADIPAKTSRDTLSTNGSSKFPIRQFTGKERKVINALSTRITASYSRQTGIVHISANMPEAKLTPQVVRLILQTLHERASAYKTAKGRNYLEFLEKQQTQQKEELEKARDRLIAFNGAESQPLNKRMELQSNYETNLDQHNSLSRQLHRIKLTIKEQMPAFRILDDITAPGNQIQPNRKLTVLLSLILGFFIAYSWVTILFLFDKRRDWYAFRSDAGDKNNAAADK
ncbi:MAG TPA: hypothetical protein VK112_06095 [Fodinibius sp.]|nr:hypothetical protein [Fodinibius sp.]